MNGLAIDPRIAMWLNVAYAVLTGLTAGGLQAAGIPYASRVIAWASLLSLPINIILHGYSSTLPGPLAPPDPFTPSPVPPGAIGLDPKR